MKIEKLLLLCLLFAITSCASFPKNKLRPVDSIASLEQIVKRDVAVEVKLFSGSPDKGGAQQLTGNREKIVSAVQKTLKDSGLFNKVEVYSNETNANAYRLKVAFFNDFNETSASVLGFVSGLSLGVIPVGGSDSYTLKMNLTRPDKKVISTRNNDGVSNWIGLIFLPFASNTPEKATQKTLDNMIRTGLNDLVAQGAFETDRNIVYDVAVEPN